MNQIFQMALKDLRLLSRDKMGAFFIIGFPILLGLFFGLVMKTNSSSGGGKMTIAVVDNDQSEMSQKFVKALQDNDSVIVEIDDIAKAKDSVRTGNRVAVLLVEKGFGETAGIFWEDPPTVWIGVDESRSAEQAMLQGFIMEAVGQLASARFQDMGSMKTFVDKQRQQLNNNKSMSLANRLAMQAFLGSVEGMTEKIDTLQKMGGNANEGGDSADNAAPGLEFVKLEKLDVRREVDPNSIRGQMSKSKSSWDISFPQAMMWGVLGCVAGFSISIARERTMGTMTRLQVAPVSHLQVLLGKALACFITVVFVVVAMTGLGMLLGMKPDSFPMLILATLSVAICFVGIMMVMAMLGKTEQSVSGAGWAINMVMAMLGGCMVPVMFMPGFMQQLSLISPIRWAILAIEGAIWREFSLAEMATPCLILITVGVVGLAVGTTMLKRTQA